jgi:uncharacterized membrane protein
MDVDASTLSAGIAFVVLMFQIVRTSRDVATKRDVIETAAALKDNQARIADALDVVRSKDLQELRESHARLEKTSSDILNQTVKTNGRVTVLEVWRESVEKKSRRR